MFFGSRRRRQRGAVYALVYAVDGRRRRRALERRRHRRDSLAPFAKLTPSPRKEYFLRQLHRVSFVTGEGRRRIQALRTGSLSSHSEMGGGTTSSVAIAMPSPSSEMIDSRFANTLRAACAWSCTDSRMTSTSTCCFFK